MSVRLAFLLAVTWACAGPARGPATPPPPPPIELVETAPIETTLESPLPDAYVVWGEMIAGAKRSLDLAEFYVSDHPGGRLEPIVRALADAVARGVRVRLLVEQSFVKTYPDTLDQLARAGADVRHLDLATGGILHAKYFIADGREAFLGSQNFDWRALEHNLELGARIRVPAIAAGLEQIFAADWARAGGEPAPSAAPVDAPMLVASPKALLPAGIRWELPAIVALIDGARRTLHLQALGYLAGDWAELETPLVRAAARGVHVELTVSDWAKRPRTIGGLQQLARVPNVKVRLVTIPPWSGGFIPFARVAHAKLLVADGARGWLGTSNWEKEYFYANRNVGLLLDDSAIVAQLEAFFAATTRYAVDVDPAAHYDPPTISGD